MTFAAAGSLNEQPPMKEARTEDDKDVQDKLEQILASKQFPDLEIQVVYLLNDSLGLVL
jgi:hypothetical protein